MKRTEKFLLLLTSIFFLSCASNNKPEVYVPVDYDEEAAVLDEIESIRKSSEKSVIKALWLSALLKEKLPEYQGALDLYSECEEKAKASLKNEKNSTDTLYLSRLYQSLVTLGCSFTEAENVLCSQKKNFSSVQEKTGEEKKSVAELIKGTVTVFVDKGIKIEKGMGLPDAVLGSGFFVSKDGYIVTNHHVISDMVDPKYEGFSRLYIRLAEDPDTRIPAKVIGWDSVMDLALIKAEIDAPTVFTLGSSEDLNVGDRVYAIGSPLGLDRTLTSGIISATDRRLFTAGIVFQIDAAVNSGNSGGPLIDEKGRVQAIVFAGVQNFQGLNFAIPVEYLKNELPFLYAGGERKHPWIGAYGKTKRKPGSGMKNEGLTIQYMLPGGSAFRSGLEEGMSIVSINGKSISSLDDFQLACMSLQSDSIVKVTAEDDFGKRSEHLVYLEKRPSSPGYEVYKHDLIGDAFVPLLGMKMVRSSSQNSRHYSVVKVLKGSAADEAGFSETDPIDILGVEINEEKTYANIQLYAKKRKNGYLDIAMGLTAPLDSPYYF